MEKGGGGEIRNIPEGSDRGNFRYRETTPIFFPRSICGVYYATQEEASKNYPLSSIITSQHTLTKIRMSMQAERLVWSDIHVAQLESLGVAQPYLLELRDILREV
jgi:hypothetical protein